MVVLAVASFSKTDVDEHWIAFGIGSNFHYIDAHEMVITMYPTKCVTLPVLQSSHVLQV